MGICIMIMACLQYRFAWMLLLMLCGSVGARVQMCVVWVWVSVYVIASANILECHSLAC